MFSWKVLWSTVLTLTVRPSLDCCPYALKASANAFFGTASDELEPSRTVFASPPGPLSQAESSEGRVTAPAPNAALRRRPRRDIRCPATLPGTAGPLNDDCAMSPSFGVQPNTTERVAWITPPSEGDVKGFDGTPGNRYPFCFNRLQQGLPQTRVGEAERQGAPNRFIRSGTGGR